MTTSGDPIGGKDWPQGLGASSRPTHAVQFYETEDFLFEAVASFLADGLRAGHPAIMIATAPHRDGFFNALKRKGLDGEAIVYCDARDTLAKFMNGGVPDARAFREQIGALIAKSANGGGPSRIRAYGEMVDLLWRDANHEGAIRLEELWNDLVAEQEFSLLCAYPMGNFYKEAQCEPFDRICHAHSVLLPPQEQGSFEPDARARELAMLRQRAGALAAEVEHRKELEQALRDALAARRGAEEALQRSERELKDFVENATVGLHWVGPRGTILWANQAELDLLGYRHDEYVGRDIADFHVDREVINDILRRLLAGQEIRDCEARLRAKDGSIRYVEISSNALFENGELKHTRCFTRDVTDRKRLERERRRQEAANAFLLEAAFVLYRSLDYETRLGELARLIVPRVADWCAVDLVREDGRFDRVTVAGETSYRPAEATIVGVLRGGKAELINEGEFSVLVVPMRHATGVVGAISAVANVSRRRFVEADLPAAIELARRAAVAIENARLYRYAQQANRAKDEFLATLSHELRTPLTAILGWARMLRLGELEEETRLLALETIERSARTQAALIDDILDLSKVVTGKIALQSERVDLTGVVKNAIDTVQLAATAKRVKVELRPPAGQAFVAGDPTRLQQIVWNLLTNAIKFSDGEATVRVSVETTRTVVRVVVRDEGIGIRPDFLPHVFEAFRQAEGSTTRAFGGLGLGLAIVKYFTEMHGGSIAAASAGDGKGSTFTITLPLAADRSDAADEAGGLAPAQADLRGTSVLVVDDDDDTRIVICAALRNCGAEVRAASSVAQACRLIDQKTPHILVADIAMPHEDGFALIGYVRSRRHDLGDIPAIAMTAMGLPYDERRILDAGFRMFARKPLEPLEFANVVAQLRK